jgi:hypothetical protein
MLKNWIGKRKPKKKFFGVPIYAAMKRNIRKYFKSCINVRY